MACVGFFISGENHTERGFAYMGLVQSCGTESFLLGRVSDDDGDPGLEVECRGSPLSDSEQAMHQLYGDRIRRFEATCGVTLIRDPFPNLPFSLTFTPFLPHRYTFSLAWTL